MNSEGAIVLLHGATLNHRMWDPVVARLRPKYQVVVPDLPGHGVRANVPFTLEATVEVVREAVRSVAPAPVILVGDSLGGYSAMAAAGHVPTEQLKGLVLSGSSSNLRGTRLPPYLLQIAVFTVAKALLGPEKLLKRLGTQLESRIDPEHARAIMAAGVRPAAFREAVWALNARDFKAIVASVDVPILFLNGSKDRGHVRFESRFVAAAKSATSERFEGAEHGISVWRSQDFATSVERFAGRVFAPGP